MPPKTKQVSYNAFKLKGTVTEPQLDGTLLPYANQKVKILKKKCGPASGRPSRRSRPTTTASSRPGSTRPSSGRWKWRSKVDHSNGFGNTKGKVWTLFFK